MKLICPECKMRYDSGKFCPECGTALIEEVVEMICPSCGTVAKAGKFCPECGTKLVEKNQNTTDSPKAQVFAEKDPRFSKYYDKKGFPKTISKDAKDLVIEELTPYAEQGIADAQLLLGNAILAGSPTNDDVIKAMNLIAEAESGGNREAFYLRAYDYLYGVTVETNLDEAEKRLLEGFDIFGEAEIASALAELYLYPEEKRDFSKAIKYAEIAAEEDIPDGYHLLGIIYRCGYGVEASSSKSLEYFKTAAALGHGDSMCQIALSYQQEDPGQTYYWANEAANTGNSDGMLLAGLCYKDGTGVEADVEKASEWFKKAANAGNVDAYAELGDYYMWTIHDYSKANDWYQKAADANDPKGWYGLGWNYQYGNGFEADAKKAQEYYEKALELGDKRAQSALDDLRDGKANEELDKGIEYLDAGQYKEALAIFKKYTKEDNARAINNLGACYFNGLGVKKDVEKGASLYKQSADMDWPLACLNYGRYALSVKNLEDARTYLAKAEELGQKTTEDDIKAYKKLEKEIQAKLNAPSINIDSFKMRANDSSNEWVFKFSLTDGVNVENKKLNFSLYIFPDSDLKRNRKTWLSQKIRHTKWKGDSSFWYFAVDNSDKSCFWAPDGNSIVTCRYLYGDCDFASKDGESLEIEIPLCLFSPIVKKEGNNKMSAVLVIYDVSAKKPSIIAESELTFEVWETIIKHFFRSNEYLYTTKIPSKYKL